MVGGWGDRRLRARERRGRAEEGVGAVAAEVWRERAWVERAWKSSLEVEEEELRGGSGMPFVRLFSQAGHVQVKK